MRNDTEKIRGSDEEEGEKERLQGRKRRLPFPYSTCPYVFSIKHWRINSFSSVSILL